MTWPHLLDPRNKDFTGVLKAHFENSNSSSSTSKAPMRKAFPAEDHCQTLYGIQLYFNVQVRPRSALMWACVQQQTLSWCLGILPARHCSIGCVRLSWRFLDPPIICSDDTLGLRTWLRYWEPIWSPRTLFINMENSPCSASNTSSNGTSSMSAIWHSYPTLFCFASSCPE